MIFGTTLDGLATRNTVGCGRDAWETQHCEPLGAAVLAAVRGVLNPRRRPRSDAYLPLSLQYEDIKTDVVVNTLRPQPFLTDDGRIGSRPFFISSQAGVMQGDVVYISLPMSPHGSLGSPDRAYGNRADDTCAFVSTLRAFTVAICCAIVSRRKKMAPST